MSNIVEQNLFFLRATKDCPLKFHDRLVYSYLAELDKSGDTASRADAMRVCGLGKDGAKGSLSRLQKFGVVENPTPRRYRALEPPDNWFHPRGSKNPKHWADKLAYNWITEPTEYAAVLSTLQALAKKNVAKRQSASGLAGMIGSNRQRVQSLLERLIASEVIEMRESSGVKDRFDVLIIAKQESEPTKQEPTKQEPEPEPKQKEETMQIAKPTAEQLQKAAEYKKKKEQQEEQAFEMLCFELQNRFKISRLQVRGRITDMYKELYSLTDDACRLIERDAEDAQAKHKNPKTSCANLLCSYIQTTINTIKEGAQKKMTQEEEELNWLLKHDPAMQHIARQLPHIYPQFKE